MLVIFGYIWVLLVKLEILQFYSNHNILDKYYVKNKINKNIFYSKEEYIVLNGNMYIRNIHRQL